jgi:hypothetical protein
MLYFVLLSLFACNLHQAAQATWQNLAFGRAFPHSTCREYSVGVTAFEFCLYKNSETVRSVDKVKEYCGWAGNWESQCIYNWVVSRTAWGSGVETEDLLELCGSIKDCAFRVVDYRPAEDILETLRRCETYVSKNNDACALHAMVKWWMADPTAEEVHRLMQETHEPSRNMGFYLAVRVHCEGVGECRGSDLMQRRCLEVSRDLADGNRSCPTKVKTQQGYDKGVQAPSRPKVHKRR